MKSKTIKTVAILLPLIGIIFGIVLGFACPVDVSDDWWTENLKFNIGLMFETWMFFDLLALFFGWLASVLEKLENIERSICGENSTINTNKPLNGYIQTAVNSIHRKFEKESTEPKPYVITGQNGVHQQNNNTVNTNCWICPNCGRPNQNYVGTCGCGEVKPQ